MIDSPSVSLLVQEVCDIALAAGRETLRFYGNDAACTLKSDLSPLTEADLSSNEIILAQLKKVIPGVPIISEEGGIPDHETRRHWWRFWLVDPLDGTKEFLQKRGEFTVNIALIEGDAPILGVVYAPAADLLYFADRDGGAWKVSRGASPARLSSEARKVDNGWTVVESRSHPSERLESLFSGLPVRSRVGIGSSLKFCLVAEGSADIYPRFGPTMEWDTAAGDCVFRYSGKLGVRQSPLLYNKPSMRNGDFIIGDDLGVLSALAK
jgi:3'(2'), 5'-bisphosphate nucleotidase